MPKFILALVAVLCAILASVPAFAGDDGEEGVTLEQLYELLLVKEDQILTRIDRLPRGPSSKRVKEMIAAELGELEARVTALEKAIEPLKGHDEAWVNRLIAEKIKDFQREVLDPKLDEIDGRLNELEMRVTALENRVDGLGRTYLTAFGGPCLGVHGRYKEFVPYRTDVRLCYGGGIDVTGRLGGFSLEIEPNTHIVGMGGWGLTGKGDVHIRLTRNDLIRFGGVFGGGYQEWNPTPGVRAANHSFFLLGGRLEALTADPDATWRVGARLFAEMRNGRVTAADLTSNPMAVETVIGAALVMKVGPFNSNN